jgi:CRP-like cAMP-binding protein
MSRSSGARPIRLSLQANDVLPEGLNWAILDGYVRTAAWDESGETITLGVWGPGEWVTNSFSTLRPVEMQCLSAVRVEQFEPSEAEILQFLQLQIRNTEQIFELNRIRSAEDRLLSLLRWISQRFGQVNSLGYRLSLKDMNLTHRSLAELCGLTRVTVTKNLNRYKALGWLQDVGESDLLIPQAVLRRSADHRL